ncbi:cytochrome P450, partial [Streptomyces scabiei]
MARQSLPYVIDPAGRDIPAEAARLRALGPAVRVELPGGIPAWAITRHTVLRDLLLDDRVSKDPRHWELWTSGWVEANPEAHWIYNWTGVTNMFTAYGPDHRRLRNLVAPAFTGRRTLDLLPRIEEITTSLLDSLSTRAASLPGRPADLRILFAYPLPLLVISELFGLTEQERGDAAHFVDMIMDTTTPPEIAGQILTHTRSVMARLLARKREQPGNDLTSALITARDQGDRLSEQELVDTLILTLGAGFETTVNLIGNAIAALLDHPDQLDLLLNGAVPWKQAIEEVLRWAPPITSLPLRFATTTIDLGEETIIQGEAILTTFGAVGWDPDTHGPRAHEFDITREPGKHLAFGHGVHHCLGAPPAPSAATASPLSASRLPPTGSRIASRTSRTR